MSPLPGENENSVARFRKHVSNGKMSSTDTNDFSTGRKRRQALTLHPSLTSAVTSCDVAKRRRIV